MQFDRASQFRAVRGRGLEREQRVSVGGEVGLRHGDAAAVHPAIAHFTAVGIRGPSGARRHDVAVCVAGDDRARAERFADHQIDATDHPVRTHEHLGHDVARNLESQRL